MGVENVYSFTVPESALEQMAELDYITLRLVYSDPFWDRYRTPPISHILGQILHIDQEAGSATIHYVRAWSGRGHGYDEAEFERGTTWFEVRHGRGRRIAPDSVLLLREYEKLRPYAGQISGSKGVQAGPKGAFRRQHVAHVLAQLGFTYHEETDTWQR
jgi:hypothetical protein